MKCLCPPPKMNFGENPEYSHIYCFESERLRILSVITSEHVVFEGPEPLSPFHTQFSSVPNQHILAVTCQKDFAPLWIFK